MQIARTASELRRQVADVQAAFVPTMGALHQGHQALITRGRSIMPATIVSIFVNPTQFGPGEDFDRYPRSFEADLDAAREAGATHVYAPSVDEIYPPADPPPVPPLPPAATEPGLEDACRPSHFAGVCQVVARLFDLIQPRIAVFGEKDYQQFLIVSQMADQHPQRWAGLSIEACPTVREPDGLAMSSRNCYLSAAQRSRAVSISKALRDAQAAPSPKIAEQAMRVALEAADLKIDYAVVRDAATLREVVDFTRPGRALIASWVDDVRLIDNAPIEARA